MRFIIFTLTIFLFFPVYSQKDDTGFISYKTLSISASACGTLDFYKNHGENDYNYVAPAGMKSMYFGPSSSFLFSSLKNRHYMFQTGIEYSFCHYFLSKVSSIDGRSGSYSNADLFINTFTIPAWFDLLCCKQKLFFGIAPSIGINPYAYIKAVHNYVTPFRADSNDYDGAAYFINYLDICLSAKVGAFFNIKNQKFMIEGKFTHGLSNTIGKPYDTGFHSDYFNLSLGYVFWKR